jgi:hypothetical protein
MIAAYFGVRVGKFAFEKLSSFLWVMTTYLIYEQDQ